MTAEDRATEFLHILESAEQKIRASESDVSDRVERVDGSVRELMGSVQRASKKKIAKMPKALRTLAEPQLDRHVKIMTKWGQQVQQAMETTEFVGQFDKSLVVVVLGKVNSGKSTLGNAIAGKIFNESLRDPYAAAGMRPEFRRHDAVDGCVDVDEFGDLPADEHGEFATNATECTSSIQTFTLGGLSWVDTPGIHSMTAENQALAKRYVDAAELVLFITSSDSPMRRGDVSELRELAGDKKRVLLVVSKFDEVEEDEDPDTGDIVRRIVPKGEDSRRAQQRFIESELEGPEFESLLARSEFFFVSEAVAKSSVAHGDAEAFSASGFPALYRAIASVVNEDALALKGAAPMKRFDALVKDLCEGEASAAEAQTASLSSMLEELATIESERNRREQELMGCQKEISSRLRAKAVSTLKEKVEELVRDHEARIEAGESLGSSSPADGAAERDIAEALSAIMLGVMSEVVGRILRDFDEGMSSRFAGFELNVPPIEDRWAQFEEDMGDLGDGRGKAIGAAVATIAAEVAIVNIWNPVGWVAVAALALGGLVAAGVGSSVGGAIGRGVSGKRTHEVRDGTNANEVLSALLDRTEEASAELVQKNLKILRETYFGAFRDLISDMTNGLRNLDKELRELTYNESV